MDKRTGLGVLLVFSLAFNIAFVGIWLYDAVYVRPMLERRRAAAGPEGPAFAGLERLNLRSEQRRRLEDLRGRLRAELTEPVRRAREARARFLSLLQDHQAEREELLEAERQMDEHQRQVRRVVMEHLLQVRETLGPEQCRRFGRMLWERQGRGGAMMGRGMQERPMHMRGPGMRRR
jgi:Spy/CpxP family protein refolding chaperone